MSNKTEQLQYNQAIDNLSYLILHYPKPLEQLLAQHRVHFEDKPTKEQFINEVIEQLKAKNKAFETELEALIRHFSNQENDPFWGTVAKGAIGVLGGLFKKKKRKSNRGAAMAAQQAAAAKRDMEMRLQRMQQAQERARKEAETRRREAAAAAQKRTNMILMGGVGVIALLGIGAVALKSNRPSLPYGNYPIQIPKQ